MTAPRLDIGFVIQATGAKPQGLERSAALGGVSTDSRGIEAGQLFVALKGGNFDGHDFVESALAKGAGAALVEQGFAQAHPQMSGLLAVTGTLTALGDLAHAWRMGHEIILAAVTGSNGKTTTKEMLAAILEPRHALLKNRGNLNNLIGLPQTLLQLGPEHGACVAEMGMNAPGEIARLTEIAAPDVGVVTNAGPAHLGRMGSMQAVANAKAELYEGLAPEATAVVNADDTLMSAWLGKLACRTLSFGTSATAQVRGFDPAATGSRQAFTLSLPGGEKLRPRLAVPGLHNVQNALAAAATAWALGVGPDEIKAGLESFEGVSGRLQIKKGATGPWLIDDTYNANPASLAAGLQALKVIAAGRRMGLILGDMKELGEASGELHQKSGKLAARMGCGVILALGRQAQKVIQGAREAGADPALALAFGDRGQLIEAAKEIFDGQDVVLVKGSRGMKMETVLAGVIGPEGDWY